MPFEPVKAIVDVTDYWLFGVTILLFRYMAGIVTSTTMTGIDTGDWLPVSDYRWRDLHYWRDEPVIGIWRPNDDVLTKRPWWLPDPKLYGIIDGIWSDVYSLTCDIYSIDSDRLNSVVKPVLLIVVVDEDIDWCAVLCQLFWPSIVRILCIVYYWWYSGTLTIVLLSPLPAH